MRYPSGSKLQEVLFAQVIINQTRAAHQDPALTEIRDRLVNIYAYSHPGGNAQLMDDREDVKMLRECYKALREFLYPALTRKPSHMRVIPHRNISLQDLMLRLDLYLMYQEEWLETIHTWPMVQLFNYRTTGNYYHYEEGYQFPTFDEWLYIMGHNNQVEILLIF